jgi:hypothetical protein
MGSLYVASVDAIATGTSLKTMIELATGSTARATLVSWWIEFDGISAAAVPVKVELLRATAAITGTGVTETKYNDYAPTPLASALHTSTGEGTPGDVLEIHRVSPTSGLIIQYPLGREPQIPVSSFMRIRVTAAVTVNATVGMVWEE